MKKTLKTICKPVLSTLTAFVMVLAMTVTTYAEELNLPETASAAEATEAAVEQVTNAISDI